MTPEETAAALASVEALAWWLAKRLHRDAPHLDVEDIAAAVRLGFVRAAQHFNPSRGFRFITYCHPAGVREARRHINRELARGLAVPQNYAVERAGVYFQSELYDDATGYDVVEQHPEPDQTSDSPARFPADFWDRVTRSLKPAHAEVLLLRYRDGLCLAEIADRIGCCKENVRQIVARALWCIKTDPNLVAYLSDLLA